MAGARLFMIGRCWGDSDVILVLLDDVRSGTETDEGKSERDDLEPDLDRGEGLR